SSFGIESARKSLEEKKQRNSTGSVGMGEWLAQLRAGANPYVDQEVIESLRMSPPLSPTTPSLTSASSASPASTPPTTPPTSPCPISLPKQPSTVVEDILSAFPLLPSTVHWKNAAGSLSGRLETIAEASTARADHRRRARCSYNGGKCDTVVTPTTPQELLTEEIGVAC
ncbi:hypothetical protein FRC11_002767, partial [Ceratobasidium sp. 423]